MVLCHCTLCLKKHFMKKFKCSTAPSRRIWLHHGRFSVRTNWLHTPEQWWPERAENRSCIKTDLGIFGQTHSTSKVHTQCPVARVARLSDMSELRNRKWTTNTLCSRGHLQLCWPNFDQFWPPPPSSSGQTQTWTCYILYKLYHVTQGGLFTDALPHSSCPRSYWMTPNLCRCQRVFLVVYLDISIGSS